MLSEVRVSPVKDIMKLNVSRQHDRRAQFLSTYERGYVSSHASFMLLKK